ncbi:hypothetical protein VNO78_33346 [Psophocarpus tetragonolobus]|uniref:Uncharacterized protein n=1 Tax=Psophocarpus tetragonolobus TaxID=3891 RepID=A0AAN9P0Z2_PSOTE
MGTRSLVQLKAQYTSTPTTLKAWTYKRKNSKTGETIEKPKTATVNPTMAFLRRMLAPTFGNANSMNPVLRTTLMTIGQGAAHTIRPVANLHITRAQRNPEEEDNNNN